MPAFATEEYRSRLDRVRSLMTDEGIEALLVLSEANLVYLTGYEGWSAYVPQAGLVTLDEDPFLVLREMDVTCATATCWLPEDRIVPYPESYIGTADRSPWEFIGAFVKERTRTSRLGVELSDGGLGVIGHGYLVDALGTSSLSDASGLVARCKVVKSDREIALMTEAAAIVDRALLAGIDEIGVGVRQCDVAASIMAALCSGTETIPGGPPAQTPTMPVGAIANAPHLKWTDERYVSDQQTNFEIGAFRHRYCCALSRTVYLGSPPARLVELHKGVLDGFQAAVENIRPGAACGDVARAFEAAFAPHGIRKESRIGYSIGVDWNDGGASLQHDDTTEIVSNMAFHVIVGVWERAEGYVFSETVRVTEDGAQSLTNVPRVLFER